MIPTLDPPAFHRRVAGGRDGSTAKGVPMALEYVAGGTDDESRWARPPASVAQTVRASLER